MERDLSVWCDAELLYLVADQCTAYDSQQLRPDIPPTYILHASKLL
jgi:hypothetical protein